MLDLNSPSVPGSPRDNPEDIGDSEAGTATSRPDETIPPTNGQQRAFAYQEPPSQAQGGDGGDNRPRIDRKPRFGRSEINREDRELKQFLERIRKTCGGTVKLKTSKRNPDGRYAFLPGSILELNTASDDLDAIETKIGGLFGDGDFRVTVLPPKDSRLEPQTFVFSFMGLSSAKDTPIPPATQPARPGGNETELERANKDGLRQGSKASGMESGSWGSGWGSDTNVIFERLLDHLIASKESEQNEQSRKLDEVIGLLQQLVKTLGEKGLDPQPLPQDPMKAVEVSTNLLKTILEAVPRVQTPPPPTPHEGPSDFEKTMALAEMLNKLGEAKGSATPQPATNVNESLANFLFKTLDHLQKMGQEAPRKQTSVADGIEAVGRIVNIMRETGLAPEAIARIEREVEKDETEEKPSSFISFIKALGPVLAESTKNFGSGLGTSLGTSLGQTLGAMAPTIAATMTTPKATSPAQPSTQVKPQPNNKDVPEGFTLIGPLPPSIPIVHPAPNSPPIAPASPSPAPPVVGTPAPGGSMASNPQNPPTTVKSPEPPLNPQRKIKLLLPRTQPSGATPAEPKERTLSAEQVDQIVAVLQSPLPAQEIATTIKGFLPVSFLQHFASPYDVAFARVEPHLTPDQRQMAQNLKPRLTEIYELLRRMATPPSKE